MGYTHDSSAPVKSNNGLHPLRVFLFILIGEVEIFVKSKNSLNRGSVNRSPAISAMRFVFACLLVLALMSVAIEAVTANNNQQGSQQQSNQQQSQQKNSQGAQNAKNGQGNQNGP
ncbi:hypothetical protein TNCV_2193961 [Trichonephila clavipes]|uniref:Uncharacterized protein n=1 Tax=Trichonephila clavipes TaxID=2585209 RepID=A0A8X6SG45_TRICX|nr:hypothetical protein TNCV_2193961 [Trichonephila clavipes]